MPVQNLVHPWRRKRAHQANYIEEMVLMVAISEVLLVLDLVVKSDCLCTPTTFYKNCWIRRFPGLLIDLQESQKRGAQVLKIYAEVSSQQCSRNCCLQRNGECLLSRLQHTLKSVSWHIRKNILGNFYTNILLFEEEIMPPKKEKYTCICSFWDRKTEARLNCPPIFSPIERTLIIWYLWKTTLAPHENLRVCFKILDLCYWTCE